ncbi:peptidase, M23/M37 family [Sphingobium indicum BiD32]|uniref:Peptidase, M23/M37 family n=1 Tax=Sphingobium indicum BiD32 TaxID=1301087 RepID=N1MP24_9SPHN|nr:M23 family metallopeptidase [Sphingobium indicum]CCW18671.1 peptidase, M23/M37 family [Sphingobium indicum BiD32]
MSARGWGGAALALLACVAFAHFCVRIVPADAPVSTSEIVDGGGALAIPVEGVPSSALADTFRQAREGGARPHDAIDIMAPRGSPVIAAGDGRIEKLFWSEAGGRTLYLRSPDRRALYYYAHLDGYAPGVREGLVVRRGQRIARVGSSGNANPAGPHLHFAVHAIAPGEPWHGGRAVNPYPLLMPPR